MCKGLRFSAILICLCISLRPVLTAQVQEKSHAEQARQILDATGVEAGLIVHLGCGDGRLTAALHHGAACCVQGLDRDAEKVQEARRFIQSRGLYGPVSAEQWDQPSLPYADNLVNLIIAEQPGIEMDEIMRVLAPRGVAYMKRGGTWHKQVKPRPENVDEWTHYLHDASNNAVAHDRVVGPPRYMQWIAGPRHTRSHEHTPSINALVSAHGRIFYVADQAPIGSVQIPPKWRLAARDAYNGILLWERPITTWFPHIINWGVTPTHLQRRLVAVGDRVYVTLGLHSPVAALDAVTGDTVRIYDATEGTEEIVWHNGILLLAVRHVADDRRSELERLAQLAAQKHSPLYARETAQPLVDGFRRIEDKADRAVLAVDADTGRLLWQKTGREAAGLRPLGLCAEQDRVFFQKGNNAVCVELKTGQELWSVPAGAPLRLVCDGTVLCAGGKTIAALSSRTGDTRWTQEPLLSDIRDAFVAGGSLWLGGFKPFPETRGPAWGPYFATRRDLATGEVLKHIECENPGHHHRCYQNKATDRYILAGRRGTEFIDLESGEVREHSWARGVCRYGVMPCNGLLYVPPHACACYVGAKVSGFCALASVSSDQLAAAVPAEDRLQRGPAYEPRYKDRRRAEAEHDDWPTYRRDAARSGFTESAVPADLKEGWQWELGGRLSSPVIADGRVFVASVDTHTVHALDADSGKSLWSYAAGGRVDSAPTIWADCVLFGCRDGYVYCVRASDGRLAWRFLCAETPRRIVASGQLESATPVHGSVLVQNGVVHVAAGRSSYLDGGIKLYRLDAQTGKMLSNTRVYSPDPQTGKQPAQLAPYAIPGVRSDILVADDEHVYLRDMTFDSQGKQQSQGKPHLFTLTDFLDDQWAHRSYWIFGTQCSVSTGCSRQEKGLLYGRLLVFDDSTIYGYGRATVHWSNQLQDGPYRLFATDRAGGQQRWERPVKIQVRAMILARDILFAVGPASEADDPSDAGATTLLAVSASNGDTLAQHRLEASPIFDGMAASQSRLYLTLENGSIVCMRDDSR